MKKSVTKIAVIALMLSLFCAPAFARDAAMEDLDVSLGELLNLEISVATKTSMALEEAPSIVSVITGDEIKNMGARNIMDVLRVVPGFDMTMMPSVGTCRVNVRGMTSSAHNNKIKVMLNGHSLSAMWGGLQQVINTIPLADIRQIEIIRGPGSALYGAGAFLAVINVITREGGDGPSVVACKGGSHNTVHPYGRLSYEKNDFKLSMYADYHETDGSAELVESDAFGTRPLSAAPGDTTNNSDYANFRGDLRYKDFYMSGYYSKITTELPIGISAALTDEDDASYMYAFGEAGYKLPITEKGNLEIRAFYDYTEQDALVEIFSEETAATVFGWTNGESVMGLPHADNNLWGAELTADYEAGRGVRFVAGTSFEYNEQFDIKSYSTANITGKPLEVNGITYSPMQYLGGMTDISENGNWLEDADRTVYAFYGQGMFDIKDRFSLEKGVKNLSLTAGVRYDNYDDFGSTLNPRFGVVYAPISDLYFKVLYGTAFRAPNFKELYAINNPATVGNAELDPETIMTAEALVGYKFTEKLSGSITFFNVKADDLVRRVPSGTPGTPGMYDNVGKAESSGIEVEARMNFGTRKYVYANATWQDLKDTTNASVTSAGGQIYTHGDFFPGNFPEFYANIGINYDLSKYVVANAWLNYVGKRERSEEMRWDGETLVRADQRDPVDARALFNASLTFQNFYKGLELQISGFNLFDADHRDPEDTGRVENDLPMEGRSFMAKVSYSF